MSLRYADDSFKYLKKIKKILIKILKFLKKLKKKKFFFLFFFFLIFFFFFFFFLNRSLTGSVYTQNMIDGISQLTNLEEL